MTIIVLLILAGITINLTVGNNGLFNRAKNAVEKYSEAEAREKLELVLFNMRAEKTINSEYNENEYLTAKITENDMKVDGDVVIVGKWKFEIWINGEKKKEEENTYGKVLQVNTILGKWGLENKYYFNGIIYSVKSYNRTLNSAEIEQNYNANKSRFNM